MSDSPPGRRALLVHAHPNPTSYSGALRDRALAGLERGGWITDVADLYPDGFAPAMTYDERRAYHTDEPILDPLVARYADLVRRANALVFVYPTWWWGMPAVMKGWVERVLVAGVGFQFDEQNRIRPGMSQINRLVGVSTYGSTRTEMALINDSGRRSLTRAMRLNTTWRCRSTWLGLYAMDRIGDLERAAFAEKVETRLAAL